MKRASIWKGWGRLDDDENEIINGRKLLTKLELRNKPNRLLGIGLRFSEEQEKHLRKPFHVHYSVTNYIQPAIITNMSH